MKILYVLCYRDNRYIRTRNILAALDHLRPNITTSVIINRVTGIARYLEVTLRLLKAKLTSRPDAVFVGFRGHEIFPLVKILFPSTPIVFDSLLSPAESLLEPGKASKFWTSLAPWIRPLERAFFNLSHGILVDTAPHKVHLARIFGVPEKKFFVLPMAADEGRTIRDPLSSRIQPELNVLFFGSCVPLHGVDHVLSAAKLLIDHPVNFRFIVAQDSIARSLREKCSKMRLSKVEIGVGFSELYTKWIPEADICLGGPFGGTPQASRVLTGKTLQFLWSAKPTLIGQNEATGIFRNKEDCLLVPQASAECLRDCLVWAAQNRESLARVGEEGRRTYLKHFSIERLSERVRELLESCAERDQPLQNGIAPLD